MVLTFLCVLCLLSLNWPSSTQTTKPRTVEQIYAHFNIGYIPFEFITPEPIKIPVPVDHVAFLKVHKTGSTTAQNMFLRYGWRKHLTFVLPPAMNKFKYPNIISLNEGMTKNNTLPPPVGKHHQMLCNHVVYDRQAFREYMPNDTFYIGILREPFEMFKSTLNYLRPQYIFRWNFTKPGSVYLNEPMKYEPKSHVRSLTNNRMATEFGASQDTVMNKTSRLIFDFVQQLDKDFGLVLIAEHFDESVVLMRRYLNWSTRDVVYINKNVALKKRDNTLVGPYDRHKYKRFATVDYALYEHFYRRLRDQIRAEGPDFDEELLYFKEVRDTVSEFCGQQNMRNGTKIIVQKSKWSERFELTNYDCDLIKKPEMKFVQDIRERQYGSRDI